MCLISKQDLTDLEALKVDVKIDVKISRIYGISRAELLRAFCEKRLCGFAEKCGIQSDKKYWVFKEDYDSDQWKAVNGKIATSNILGIRIDQVVYVANDGKSNFVPIIKDDNQNKYIPDLVMAKQWVQEKWMLKKTKTADISPKIDSAIDSAIKSVNDMFGKDGTLMDLLLSVPGWEIPVIIDTETDLEQRRNADGDLLGLYRYTPIEKELILYAKAIEDFHNQLQGAAFSLEHLFAYVLAHELFHAYQDFHVSLTEHEKPHQKDPMIETFAEFFALRFVKDCLNDDGLFQALCDWRKDPNNNSSDPYAQAVNHFGDISGNASVTQFRCEQDSWECNSVFDGENSA